MSDKDIKEILTRLESIEQKFDSILEANSESEDLEDEELTDEMIVEALYLIKEGGRVSASYLQRVMDISFTLATELVNKLEEDGAIGPAIGAKPREILIDDPTTFLTKKRSN